MQRTRVALTALGLVLAFGTAAGAADRVAIDELLRNARMWQSLNRPDNQRLVLTKILAVDADEPQALLMLGELELRAGRPAEAQRLLLRLQRGGAMAAAAELQDLQRLYTSDAARLSQLRLLRRGGNTEAALALARDLFPGGRPPGALATEFAPLLADRAATRPRAQRAPAATAAAPPPRRADTVARPAEIDPAAPAAVQLQATLQDLQRVGRFDEALEMAARDNVAALIDIGVLRDAATAASPGAALRWLEAGVALLPRSPWLRHDLARRYAGLGQPALARAVVAEGLALAPADAEMRFAAALVYAALDSDDEALAALDAIPAAERSEGQRALATRLRQAQAQRAADAAQARAEVQRRADTLEARRQPTDEVALFPLYRHAAAGRSSLAGAELPLVLTRPLGGDGHRWLHVDAVRLDAGALPAAFDEAALFGQVQATGAPLAAALPQRATGLSAGIGWTGDERRWDIGIIGAGFAVPNLVGGWREAFTLAGNDASIELSRRVLTGSLLSYAGTQDPVSGRTWGGVTLSAVSLRLGRDIAGWSSSASLRAGLLDGRNVADNNVVQLRLASDRDWHKSAALSVNAGVTLAVWRYRDNLGFHSFGQGGYYSPQRYTSLGLPVEMSGRLEGAWSYKLRSAVSRSWTFEADTPYYPTEPALQAATGNPVHAGGGSGGGWSGSVRADVERRLDAHWAAGASLIADRSAYYAPTQMLFYLRRSWKPQTGDVALPRPVVPYSQF